MSSGSASYYDHILMVGVPQNICDESEPCGYAFMLRYDGVRWTTFAQLTSPESDLHIVFGESVALSHEFAFVGASSADCAAGYNCGAVFVFRRAGDSFEYDSKLTASDAVPYHRFGEQIELFENTLFISDTRATCDGGLACGAVYVFELNEGVWTESAILTASDAAAMDKFGSTLAVDENRLAVGVPAADCANGGFCGAVYIFERMESGWTETAKLEAPDAESGDGFGVSAALAGESLAVGSYRDDCETGNDCGSVYIFDRVEGQWIFQTKETAPTPTAGAFFGNGLSILQDTLFVGAPTTTNDGESGAVFAKGLGPDCNCNGLRDACDVASNAATDCNRNLIPDSCDIASGTSLDCGANGLPDECEQDCQSNGVVDDCDIANGSSTDCNTDSRPDECGVEDVCAVQTLRPNPDNSCLYNYVSLSSDGSRMIMGDVSRDSLGDCLVGLAHIYRLENDEWEFEATLSPPFEKVPSEFGYSVAIDGDFAVVGAPKYDCLDEACPGAFMYRFDGQQWEIDHSFSLHDIPSGDTNRLGESVALSGDVVVIGSPFANCPFSSDSCGALYVLRRTNEVWVMEQKLQAPGNDDIQLGASVAIDNDVIVAGAPEGGPPSDCGEAHVFRYDGLQWQHEAQLRQSPLLDSAIGYAVAISGDRIALGGPGIDGWHNEEYNGAVFIYRFQNGQWQDEPRIEAPDTNVAAYFGYSVALRSDWLIVGGRNDPCPTATHCGAVYVFRWNTIGVRFVEKLNVSSGHQFGNALALTDDFTLVGNPYASCFPSEPCKATHVFALGGEDCNCNAHTDACELAGGASDLNQNMILDSCESDLDGDSDVDLRDFSEFAQCFTADTTIVTIDCNDADLIVNTFVDLDDYEVLNAVLSAPRH